MISCTDFIFAYSELFSFLEENYGQSAVHEFWQYLFRPVSGGIALADIVKREGIRGCFSYWKESLNEEAADFTMYLNEKRGYFKLAMHKCPSKGRLLEGCDKCQIKPYRDYCLHCDHYRVAVEQAGLRYIYDFSGMDKASCSMLIYDPKIFDGRVIVDEDTEIMDRRASDNPYFHQHFHWLLNMAAEYVAEKYGAEALEKYLSGFAQKFYSQTFADVSEEGLPAIARVITAYFEKEKCPDALCLDITDNALNAQFAYDPAIRHFIKTGKEASKWYLYIHRIILQSMANAGGYCLTQANYDSNTGACTYRIEK